MTDKRGPMARMCEDSICFSTNDGFEFSSCVMNYGHKGHHVDAAGYSSQYGMGPLRVIGIKDRMIAKLKDDLKVVTRDFEAFRATASEIASAHSKASTALFVAMCERNELAEKLKFADAEILRLLDERAEVT